MTETIAVDVAVAQGADALEAVAVANERMIEFGRNLRQRPEVRRALPGVDLRRYRSGSMLALYIEAELRSSDVLCWWIEVGWSNRWTIESRLLLNRDDGQLVVHAYPDRSAGDPAGFATELARAIELVAESIADIDLARY